MKTVILLAISFILVGTVCAQDGFVVSGLIIDSTTKEPIPGASIRVQGTTSGTYSRSGGRYRLPLRSNEATLHVRSVGYKERTITVRADVPTITISLIPSSLSLSGVKVVGDIPVEEVIRRAVARKEENAGRITSIVSTVYSKMRSNIDLGGLDGVEGPDRSITETFSTIYERRRPDRKKHVRILQRRQTANISAQENLAVFDEFFDFTLDEITLIKTRLVTPLGKEALDEYNYRMLGKKTLGDQMVYEIAFEPKSRLFPGFEGTLTIIEGSYQIIAATFKPTDETAVPFLKGLTFDQRYERVNDSIWAPTYQHVAARAQVTLFVGLAELEAGIEAQTYVTDVKVNVPIDDTLLNPPPARGTGMAAETDAVSVRVENTNSTVTVAPDADSTKSEYWEQHAFAEVSDEERLIYAKQDSIERSGTRKRKGSSNDDDGVDGGGSGRSSLIPIIDYKGWSVGLDPMLDRSSITGLVYGGTINVSKGPVDLSFGGGIGDSSRTVGQVDLGVTVVENDDMKLRAFGTVMSSLASVQGSRTILRRLDFLNLSNVLYTDNFDFFRRDGWEVGLSAKTDVAVMALSGSWTRHINMSVIESVDRTVIKADAGDYQMVQFSGVFFEPSIMDQFLGTASPVSFRLNGLVGRETASDIGFWSVDASVNGRIPTFETGYAPMELDVVVHAGIQDTRGPIQTRFAAPRRFPLLGSRTDLTTVEINAFAGTEFVHTTVEHNFSDLWWRLIGLPTFSMGRGVDLIGRFGALNTTQRATPVVPGRVFDSTPGWYMEAGFAVSRIPTFVSDLVWLRFDAMWPVGPLSNRGSFGWALTLSSPLL